MLHDVTKCQDIILNKSLKKIRKYCIDFWIYFKPETETEDVASKGNLDFISEENLY